MRRKPSAFHLANWIREYAATLVVAFCVLLVALLNAASAKDFSGSLFGSFTSATANQTDLLRNKMAIENAKKNNLATVAVLNADSLLSPKEVIREEEMIGNDYAFYEPTFDINSQIVLAVAGPQMMAGPPKARTARIYEVKEGDTASSIAAVNGVSVNTVLSANNLSEISLIRPGDKLTILPITGANHKVQKGDTLDAIAKKYNSDSQKILVYNELPADGNLKEGQTLVIPDGYLSVPAPSTGTRLATAGQSQTASSGTVYAPIKMTGGGTGHRFPYGYCTWYVSQRRYVPWGGNAGAWLANARASGKATGRAPKAGAIIVTGESRWGHVGIVEKVNGNTVTISEMNYNGFGKKSTRTINANSRTVKGFIY